ncbi:MAG: replication initiator protein [Microviridae sp.]|nr:MAG: replication initiator protein [Microviridae sp.]
MCLYPRLIENRKYKPNKKNGGNAPPVKDHRTTFVPIGCQKCIECKNMKSREWQTRLQEDIKENRNGKFITLTYSEEALKAFTKTITRFKEIKYYDLQNEIATISIRLFLERWRKKYKKSIRHWMVTEIGGKHTERLHMHGIMWTDHPEEIEKIWQYGWVWRGYEQEEKGKYENYVNAKTINYIIKYVTKIDEKHPDYKSIILTSPGIGDRYTKKGDHYNNKYNGKETDETYRLPTGQKMALPIYWRNKIYTDEEREKLWLHKLDEGYRYICGEKVHGMERETYYNLLEYHRRRTRKLGYQEPELKWSKAGYEEMQRRMNEEQQLIKSEHIQANAPSAGS